MRMSLCRDLDGSPHAAGAAALMVQRYPTWTPAEIKSALAMTAYQDVLKENGVDPAGFLTWVLDG